MDASLNIISSTLLDVGTLSLRCPHDESHKYISLIPRSRFYQSPRFIFFFFYRVTQQAAFQNEIPRIRQRSVSVAEIRNTRALFFSQACPDRAYIFLPSRDTCIIFLALLPFLTSRSREEEAGDGKEKEIARSAATRMFIYTKCNRRTAISFVSRTPAPVRPRGATGERVKGVKGEGEGEREKEKSRKEG